MRQLIADYAEGYDLIMQAIYNVSEEELNYKSAPERCGIRIFIHFVDFVIRYYAKLRLVHHKERSLRMFRIINISAFLLSLICLTFFYCFLFQIYMTPLGHNR